MSKARARAFRLKIHFNDVEFLLKTENNFVAPLAPRENKKTERKRQSGREEREKVSETNELEVKFYRPSTHTNIAK